MTKFSDRIKKSSHSSAIILANDYSNRIPKLEAKTIQNIKSLHEHICGIKLNFHLLLNLGIKEFTSYTMDLTKKYIEINADYRT